MDESIQNVENQVKDNTQDSSKASPTKRLIFKIIVAALALGCVILVIIILAKSSKYFSILFALSGNQIIAKSYLKQYYSVYMATLYISIIGFVIVVADTALFFYRFSQKPKVLWFHLAFFISFFICGIVNLSDSDYKDAMTMRSTFALSNPACTTLPYIFQCLLSPSSMVVFFAIFCVFFVIYTGLYHYSVLYIVPYEPYKKEQSEKNDNNKSQADISKQKNEAFVSEMFDQYGN